MGARGDSLLLTPDDPSALRVSNYLSELELDG